MAPKLSFCIMTYNRAHLIEQALASVQELVDLGLEVEAIVGDDASTDNTPEVIAKLSAKYPFVRYYRNSRNFGAYENFVLCQKRALGDYVVPLADDDTLLSREFPSIVSILDSRPDIAMVTAPYVGFHESTGKEYGLPDADTPPDDPTDLALVTHNDFARAFELFVNDGYFPEIWILRRAVIDTIVGGLSDSAYTSHAYVAHGLKCGHLWMRRRPFYRSHFTDEHLDNQGNSLGKQVWRGDFEVRFRAGLEYFLYHLKRVAPISPLKLREYQARIDLHIFIHTFNAACFLFTTKEYNRSAAMLQRAYVWAATDNDLGNCRTLGKALVPSLCADRVEFLAREALKAEFLALCNDREDAFFQSVAVGILSSGRVTRVFLSHAVETGLQMRTAVLVQRPELVPSLLAAGFRHTHLFVLSQILDEFHGLSEWLD